MTLAQDALRLSPNLIDYLLIAFYFVLVLGIGFAARRSVSSSLDFLLSGRSMPAWITGLAFISANLGAIELIGMIANGAQYGVPMVHYYWIGAIPAMVFLGIVMMPFYYGSKARSVPEFLLKRFNRTTQRVQAVVFAVASILIAGVNLFSLGLVLEALLGWPLPVAIPVAAVDRARLHHARRAVRGDLHRGAAVLRDPRAADPADDRRAEPGRWVGRSDGGRHGGPGWRGGAVRLARHLAHRDPEPVPVRAGHRLRSGLRAVLRLLDDELRRGPARAVGQEHVRRAAHADHRGVPEDAGRARHPDPRHGRRRSSSRRSPRSRRPAPTASTAASRTTTRCRC